MTKELDAIAAARRRLPMVEMPDYTLIGADGPIRLVDIFKGRSQLIVYNHMWNDGAEWQCGGCTSLTSQYTRLDFLDNYSARFVIVTNGPIDEALAYRDKVGNRMEWYSSSESSFGADVDAAPNEGFAFNVFLRDGDTVYRTWHTNGRGVEQLTLHISVEGHSSLGPAGGMARLTGRMAVASDLLGLAGQSRRRPALRERRLIRPPAPRQVRLHAPEASSHETVGAEGGDTECREDEKELPEWGLTERLDRGVEAGGLRRIGLQRRDDHEDACTAPTRGPWPRSR